MKRAQFNILVFDLFRRIFGFETAKYLHFQMKKSKLLSAPALFVHIPKAAGTSVADVLYGERIGHYSLDDYFNYLGKEQLERSFCFSVVRDPYQRLVSAWRYARNGGTKEGGVRNPAYYQQAVFQKFDDFVQQWLVHQDLERCELLFRTQCHFIKSKNQKGFQLDAVYYLDQPDALERKLSELIGKPVKLPRKNMQADKGSSKEQLVPQSKTLSLIYELYSCDYEEFGFEKPF